MVCYEYQTRGIVDLSQQQTPYFLRLLLLVLFSNVIFFEGYLVYFRLHIL